MSSTGGGGQSKSKTGVTGHDSFEEGQGRLDEGNGVGLGTLSALDTRDEMQGRRGRGRRERGRRANGQMVAP